jgi:hypothetical protein
MIYLAASIISSTAIYVIFKWAKNYNCKLNALITMNYLVATILGFGFLMRFNSHPFFENNHWLPSAIILGSGFIDSFIKYVQALQITDQLPAAYSSVVFFTAFVCGVLLVFALNNMLIVSLSALLGFFIFKEKLNRLNIAGIVLALISLYILL